MNLSFVPKLPTVIFVYVVNLQGKYKILPYLLFSNRYYIISLLNEVIK
jgi:hypothetical protein